MFDDRRVRGFHIAPIAAADVGAGKRGSTDSGRTRQGMPCFFWPLVALMIFDVGQKWGILQIPQFVPCWMGHMLKSMDFRGAPLILRQTHIDVAFDEGCYCYSYFDFDLSFNANGDLVVFDAEKEGKDEDEEHGNFSYIYLWSRLYCSSFCH